MKTRGKQQPVPPLRRRNCRPFGGGSHLACPEGGVAGEAWQGGGGKRGGDAPIARRARRGRDGNRCALPSLSLSHTHLSKTRPRPRTQRAPRRRGWGRGRSGLGALPSFFFSFFRRGV